ncbi:hypothetical protein RHMOL_Rhmol07G0142800 [Rhododendron molle]|uniref:Uncharacterized protein n=1 Tax=Rhododendron molle TaxID=49168 RepID=A0ACC0N0T8_RHOML|nr:hypothetical protein RHMOL_Rhmol07G0142800 [Rhododendron molle]
MSKAKIENTLEIEPSWLAFKVWIIQLDILSMCNEWLDADHIYGRLKEIGTSFMDIVNSSQSYATGGTSVGVFCLKTSACSLLARADLVPQLPPSHLFESSTPETLPSIVHASNIAIPSSSSVGHNRNGHVRRDAQSCCISFETENLDEKRTEATANWRKDEGTNGKYQHQSLSIIPHSKVATETWNNMSDAEKTPFIDMANQTKTHTKEKSPKRKVRLRWNMFTEGDEELKRGATFAMMQEVFELGVADAKFQTSYILFVLSCLLCPTTKDVASTKFYPVVYDLTKTRSYAWPQFVLDWLVKEITKFKKRDAKVVDNKKDALGVSVCVLLLMETVKCYHAIKKAFVEQLLHLIVMNASLMSDVPETSTCYPSNGKDVNEIESPKDDDASLSDEENSDEIPSTSTSTPKKVGKGVAMDEDRISGFHYV